MENILIKDLYRNTEKYLDNEVQISGWVKTLRDSKNFGFIELNDGSFSKIFKLFLILLFLISKMFENYLLVLLLS